MPITMPNYYAVLNPEFKPAMRNILSITNAVNALITTTYDGINPGPHQYLNGLIIRVRVPNGFGMIEIDELYGIVTVVDANSFTVNIDTTLFTPFVVPSYNPGHYGTPAQTIPFGEINDSLLSATQNVLPTGQGIN
jgi:hypothetical protein